MILGYDPVSYTHLDVYKRQVDPPVEIVNFWPARGVPWEMDDGVVGGWFH